MGRAGTSGGRCKTRRGRLCEPSRPMRQLGPGARSTSPFAACAAASSDGARTRTPRRPTAAAAARANAASCPRPAASCESRTTSAATWLAAATPGAAHLLVAAPARQVGWTGGRARKAGRARRESQTDATSRRRERSSERESEQMRREHKRKADTEREASWGAAAMRSRKGPPRALSATSAALRSSSARAASSTIRCMRLWRRLIRAISSRFFTPRASDCSVAAARWRLAMLASIRRLRCVHRITLASFRAFRLR